MIEIPYSCPSCDAKLVRVKNQLFCRNTDCASTVSSKIEKFASKVKIKGLGPASIYKLGLSNIYDIYDLTEEFLEESLGKNGFKVYKEIQNKTTLSIGLFIGSISIPLVGATIANKIHGSLEDISYESLINDGIGNKASINIFNWLNSNKITDKIDLIPNVFEEEEEVKLTVCISGKIPGYTKSKLEAYLSDYNIKVISTVNKNIDYLISQETISAKAQKAIKLNIKVITIDELKEIL